MRWQQQRGGWRGDLALRPCIMLYRFSSLQVPYPLARAAARCHHTPCISLAVERRFHVSGVSTLVSLFATTHITLISRSSRASGAISPHAVYKHAMRHMYGVTCTCGIAQMRGTPLESRYAHRGTTRRLQIGLQPSCCTIQRVLRHLGTRWCGRHTRADGQARAERDARVVRRAGGGCERAVAALPPARFRVGAATPSGGTCCDRCRVCRVCRDGCVSSG